MINSSLVYNKIWIAFISNNELSQNLLGKKSKQNDDSCKINWWKEGLGEGAVTSTSERWGHDASWLANECKFHLQFTFIQSSKLVLASPNISCVLRALAALQVSFSLNVCVCTWANPCYSEISMYIQIHVGLCVVVSVPVCTAACIFIDFSMLEFPVSLHSFLRPFWGQTISCCCCCYCW